VNDDHVMAARHDQATYRQALGLGTWAAYTGINVIMSKMTGAINSATFKSAVNNTPALTNFEDVGNLALGKK
jgi:hypothetical protein